MVKSHSLTVLFTPNDPLWQGVACHSLVRYRGHVVARVGLESSD